MTYMSYNLYVEFDLEDDIERIRYLLLAVQREGSRMLATELAPIGLTPSQAEVLRLLVEYEPLTLTGLGELLVCESGTNPSRLVARLIDAGFVQKEAVAADARQIKLTLTPLGRERQVRSRQVEHDLHARMQNALKDIDLTTFTSALENLVQGTSAGEAIARRTPTKKATLRA